MLILSILLGLLALGGIGWLVSLFNSLIQVKNNIGKAWANIEVLLLQRNEELPKLIGVTKCYVQYEKHILESLTKLRSLYTEAKRTDRKIKLENEMAKKISELKVVWEGYPELKANEVFLKLQARISDLEASIADRCTFFNETVTIYNTRREIFPQLVFAWMFGFRRHPFLDIPKESRR